MIPGSGRSPEEGNPLGMATHSSICLENSMNRGTWKATVHMVTESDIKRLSTHNITFILISIKYKNTREHRIQSQLTSFEYLSHSSLQQDYEVES